MAKQYIFMAGTAGAGAALYESERIRADLEKRYPKAFLRKREQLLKEDEMLRNTVLNINSSYCGRFGEKGLFGKLWEMASALGTGVKGRLEYVPTDPFAVEVMELLDRNIYEEPGGNGVLVVSEDMVNITEFFTQKGIRCAVIGTLTKDRACVIDTDHGRRYLTPERKQN